MKIARVFARKTTYCPTDEDCYFSPPKLNTPIYDEVHISCTFTWDIQKAKDLAIQWLKHGKVKIGGVAINGEPITPSIPGRYIKNGVVFTSRGCPNRCSFCLIKQDLIEFDDFPEGNIIQDNNFLACSDRHRDKVFTMLKNQRNIHFQGGLEAARITPKIAEQLRSVSIKALWLACDSENAVKPFRKAVGILHDVGFTANHIYAYVLIGKDMYEEERRLYDVLAAGAMPFAQLYQPLKRIDYSQEWKDFRWEWSRWEVIRSKLKEVA